MTDAEFEERIRAIKRERARGFYVDALELEVQLWRDIGGESATAAWESLAVGGPTAKLVRFSRLALRELHPTTATV